MVGKIPCSEGNADCCNGRIDILRQDEQLIKEAVENGEILPEVINKALVNSQDQNRKDCPFLGNDRRCSINPYKPLVCVSFGYGGVPLFDKLGKRRRDKFKKGVDLGISVADLRQDFTLGMCVNCFIIMSKENTRIPLSCLTASNNSALYVAVGVRRPIREFINELVSDKQ